MIVAKKIKDREQAAMKQKEDLLNYVTRNGTRNIFSDGQKRKNKQTTTKKIASTLKAAFFK